MIKAHMKKDGSYDECHATKRACPLGGSEVHREFKDLNEMIRYNEKMISEGSINKKLTKVDSVKEKDMDKIINDLQLEYTALKNRKKLRSEYFMKLRDERNEFEKNADHDMRRAFRKIKKPMEKALKASFEAQNATAIAHLDHRKLNLHEISDGMQKLAPYGLKMSDFLNKESVLKIQADGTDQAVRAVNNKLPYKEVNVTPDGDNAKVEAMAYDSDGKPFTISGIMSQEEYINGVNKNFDYTREDYKYINKRGIKESIMEDEWPSGIGERIKHTDNIIKRNGLSSDNFPTIIMNTGSDSNRMLGEELELDRREEEINPDEQLYLEREVRRMNDVTTAAEIVRDDKTNNKDLYSTINNLDEWHVFNTDGDYESNDPTIGEWLDNHNIKGID